MEGVSPLTILNVPILSTGRGQHRPLLGLNPLSLQPQVTAVQTAAQRGQGTGLRLHSQAQSPVSASRTQAEAVLWSGAQHTAGA